MIKKKKYFENPFYLNLKDKIINNNDKIYIPKNNLENKNNNVLEKSCFKIIKNNNENDIDHEIILNNKYTKNKKNKIENVSKKIILEFNKDQKHILKQWFKANDLMYNETIKFIKENFIIMKNEYNNNEDIKLMFLINDQIKNLESKITNNKKKINKKNISEEEILNIRKILLCLELNLKFVKKEYEISKNNVIVFLKNKPYTISYNKFKLDYQNIRTYFLKNKRNEIINNCNSTILNKDIKIKTHILDATIKLACSNYQSAITNFENGNIKKFRIRYWKEKRETRILEIEDCYFSKNTLCNSIFGLIKGYLERSGEIECSFLLKK